MDPASSSTFRQELERRLHSQSYVRPETLLKEANELDHPDLGDLRLGQGVDGEAVVAFLDIRGYTRLAMALDPSELSRILAAVIGAAVVDIKNYGGHINDFTGDGVMAVFGGPGAPLSDAHADAIYGVSHLMAAMQATLREDLLKSGISDPVQVAMGVVSGPARWTKVGTEETNRVMILGEIAPLASKYVSGEETNAWEIMIGGEILDAVPVSSRTRRPDFERTYHGTTYKRERWLLDWSDFNGLNRSLTASRLKRGSTTLGPALGVLAKPRYAGASNPSREYPTG